MFADAHCDFLYKAAFSGADYERPEEGQAISHETLSLGNVGLQVFAIWSDVKRGRGGIDSAMQMIAEYNKLREKGYIYDFLRDRENGRTAGVLALEGGDALEGSIENLYKLYNAGVRILAPVWNDSNALGHGCLSGCDGGLTRFGREVVEAMGGLNMALDLSHINREGFHDCVRMDACRIMASHSNVYSLCGHERNLGDFELRAIASSGGFIGICFYPAFLRGEGRACIDDIRCHIEYAINLCGVSCIGFGSDFDGIETTPEGIDDPRGFALIRDNLIKNHWKKDNADRICHDNLLEYIQSCFTGRKPR